MNITSIYEEHFHGETYRTGVAYLRARGPDDDRAPRRVGTESLEEQRRLIAQAAREQQTIIVAEFIEYGDQPFTVERSALDSLIALALETGIRECFVLDSRYLASRRSERSTRLKQLSRINLELTNVYD